MAINELHSRLEYLVSYSSQLIFIGCDSLSQQQSALQQFLATQHENAEVAFLNGEPDNSDADYRRLIYQQLTANTQLSNSPLPTNLLKNLAKDSGPFLICVCAAQHISASLVNELWELVLANKNSSGQHHLNVLLFGDPDWTRQAKQTLSVNSQFLPVMLSSEILSADGTSLLGHDAISQNRQLLRKKMLHSAQQSEDSGSIIHTSGFKYTIAGIFILLFSSLIYWQYQPQIDAFLAVSYAPEQESGQEQEPLQAQKQEQEQEPGLIAPVEESSPDAIEQALVNAPQPAPVEQPTTTETRQTLQQQMQAGPEQRVTDWHTAVEQLKSKPESAPEPSSSPSPAASSQAESEVIPADVQSDQGLAAANSVATTAPLTDRQRISSFDQQHYVLQLAAMADPQVLTQFVQTHQLQEISLRYVTQRFGGDWHVLLFEQSFETAAQARQAVQSLPASLDKTTPFAKSVKQVKDELVESQE